GVNDRTIDRDQRTSMTFCKGKD
ncbi:hypothetical protein A5865_001402, partial [Enterococcus sp. 12E11_DIV0728]